MYFQGNIYAFRFFGVFFTLFFSFFSSFHPVFAQMASDNYLLQWDALTVGGLDDLSSSSYRVRSSVDSGVSAEILDSSGYVLDGGYRGGVYDPVSRFMLFVQDRTSQVAATALSGTEVTLSNTTGFSVGDRIVIVQNEGADQSSAVGRIASLAGSTVTVHSFSGDSLVIDGSGGDYAYRMTPDGSSLPLGTPTSSTVATGIVAWEATADVRTGYSVYVFDDGNLRTGGADEIADVVDGEVSVGASEYGARSSDASLADSLFDSQDTAITQSPQLVASRNDVAFFQVDYLTLKLGVSSLQAPGDYSHQVYLVFSGNY